MITNEEGGVGYQYSRQSRRVVHHRKVVSYWRMEIVEEQTSIACKSTYIKCQDRDALSSIANILKHSTARSRE